MVTLIKNCKTVKVVRDLSEVPSGTGSLVVSPTVVVHVLVRVSSPVMTAI